MYDRRFAAIGGLRRSGIRSPAVGGGAAAVPDPGGNAYTISAWGATNGYWQASGSGVESPRCWLLLFEIGAPGTTQVLVSRANSSATRGWGVRWTSGTGLQAFCANGAGTLVTSPGFATAGIAGDGKLHALIATLNSHGGAAGHLRLYVDSSTEVGSGTALTGYTVPTSADQFSIGSLDAGGVPASSFGIMGVATVSAVPTTGQIATWLADIKAANDTTPCPAGVTEQWSVQDNGRSLPTTWAEETGSGPSVSKQGTLTLNDKGATPTYAF